MASTKADARGKPAAPADESRSAAPRVTSGQASSRADAGADTGAGAPPSVGAPAAAAPARVLTLAELPGDVRQQVPPLSIGGSVYSPQASARMIVVNGQVFQEGNALTPELTLEQIRPKSAVFNIRGQRFEVPL
jgi:general secretion pathway protein B